VRPFRLNFHTDGVEAPNDIDNRGFCLDYVQQPCTNGYWETQRWRWREVTCIDI